MNKREFDREIPKLMRKGINLKETKLYCIIWHDGSCGENTIYIQIRLGNCQALACVEE